MHSAHNSFHLSEDRWKFWSKTYVLIYFTILWRLFQHLSCLFINFCDCCDILFLFRDSLLMTICICSYKRKHSIAYHAYYKVVSSKILARVFSKTTQWIFFQVVSFKTMIFSNKFCILLLVLTKRLTVIIIFCMAIVG